MSVEFEDFPLYDDPVYSETSLSPVGREIAGLHCSISKSMMSQFEAASPTESRRIWFRLIEDYSRRLLSVPNDKLPAVSAIASWLFGNNRKDYLAGLPNSALHEGLAWKTMHHVPYKGRHSGCAYRAPSWSWACTDFPVNFITSLKYMAFRNDSDHRRIRRRDDGRKIRRRDDVMSKQHKLEIHHTAIELAGSDPFGRLVSGSIKLRARTKIFRVVHKVSSSTYQVAEHISGNVIGVFYADDPLWYSSMDTATQNEDGAAEPGEGRNERPPTSGPCHDDSDFEGRNMEVKCLCIDSFDEFDWVAIVIEELPLGHTERFTNRSATPSAYRPYRRMGLVEHNPWIRGSDSEWFLDSPWELIELF